MHAVHIFLAASIISISLIAPGCSTSAETTTVPEFHEEELPPVDSPGIEAPRPRGDFVGDMRSRVFHKPECGEAKGIPEIEQVEFETPWPAINDGFEPCPRCYPLTGWK